ncbi:MAG TPA: hypothetical protein VK395_21910 [Gemmataceae bacterium]|nr:hypothetical protein [Gemmataceae bacterium]
MDAHFTGRADKARTLKKFRVRAARYVAAAQAWKELLAQEQLWQLANPGQPPAANAAPIGDGDPHPPERTFPPKGIFDWLWVSTFGERLGVDPATEWTIPSPALAAGKACAMTERLEQEGGELDTCTTCPPAAERPLGEAGFLTGCLVGLCDFTRGRLNAFIDLPLQGAHPQRLGANIEQLAKKLRELLKDHDCAALQKFNGDLSQIVLPAHCDRLSEREKGRLTTRVALKYASLLKGAGNTTRVLAKLGKASVDEIASLGRKIAHWAKRGRIRKPKKAPVSPKRRRRQALKARAPSANGRRTGSLPVHCDNGTGKAACPTTDPSHEPRWTPPKGWHGPSKQNGSWLGERGNSGWLDNRPEIQHITQGEPVPFILGRIVFDKWMRAEFHVPGVKGGRAYRTADFRKIHRAIIKKENLGVPGEKYCWRKRGQIASKWLREQPDGFGGKGLKPHHAGGDVIQYIPAALHKIQHTDVQAFVPLM